MKTPIFVLGGYQTDFARNFAREGLDISDLVREGVEGTLGAADIEPSRIQSIHVGNAFGELFTGQAQLGAMPATVVPGLWGAPASRHEAACASGGVAVLAAMAEIEAGRYDCVLVLGVEQERNVAGDLAARHMGSAAFAGREGEGCRYMWPHMFSLLADEYERRHGLSHAHLARLAEKSFANARRNPKAQTRSWTFGPQSFGEDDLANPVIEGRLRRQDCGQVTDGAAGVVLCSASFAKERLQGAGDPAHLPRILGWGHRTAGLPLAEKLRRSQGDDHVLPHVRDAIQDAFRRAELRGHQDLDGIETHDCFTITEYMAIDHFGITPPGRSHEAIDSGMLEASGKLPMNPSGGLVGLGHPVGATGVRMLVDAANQVSGEAGACQVEGARTFATLNIGGSGTTAVSLVVGRDL